MTERLKPPDLPRRRGADDPARVREIEQIEGQRNALFRELQAKELELKAKDMELELTKKASKQPSPSVPPERRKLTLMEHLVLQGKQRLLSIVLGGALGGGAAHVTAPSAPSTQEVAVLQATVKEQGELLTRGERCRREWQVWQEEMVAYEFDLWDRIAGARIRGRNDFPSRSVSVTVGLEVNGKPRTYEVNTLPPDRPNCR